MKKNLTIKPHATSLLLALALLIAFISVGCDKKAAPSGEPVAINANAEKGAKAEKAESEEEVKNYAIMTPNEVLEVGGPNEVTLEIQSRNGLKINHEFPWKIKFKSSDRLIVDEGELTSKQIEMGEKSVKMKINVTPTEEGTLDLEGTGTFSVCSVKMCDIRRNEPLRFTFVAEHRS